MFIIDCTTGKNIRNHSFFETENEMLLLPGTYFEVVGSLRPAKDFCIIQLREIQPEVPLLSMLPVSTTSIIDLSKHHLTDDDLSSVLPKELEKKSLSHLNLNENHITDTGVRLLNDILRLYPVTCSP